MKSAALFLAVMAMSAFPAFLHAQSPAPPLPEASKAKVLDLLKDIQLLNARQRYVEAMQKLSEADALAPDSALLANVRGSIYTSMRDFQKARSEFERAQKLAPGSFEPRFNLAELDYVEQHYAEAEAAFTKILKSSPKVREEVRHLMLFKIVVCQLKQDKTAEAAVTTKPFTSMDDTPAYFFCKAAFSYQNKNEKDAQAWIAKAQGIFKTERNAPYIDTLMEARWLKVLSGQTAREQDAK